MADKPIVFHQIFKSFDSNDVSKRVQDTVDKLYKSNDYHQIKVIVHEPLLRTYPNSTTNIEYSTTVIATRDNVHIDIGFNSPS